MIRKYQPNHNTSCTQRQVKRASWTKQQQKITKTTNNRIFLFYVCTCDLHRCSFGCCCFWLRHKHILITLKHFFNAFADCFCWVSEPQPPAHTGIHNEWAYKISFSDLFSFRRPFPSEISVLNALWHCFLIPFLIFTYFWEPRSGFVLIVTMSDVSDGCFCFFYLFAEKINKVNNLKKRNLQPHRRGNENTDAKKCDHWTKFVYFIMKNCQFRNKRSVAA